MSNGILDQILRDKRFEVEKLKISQPLKMPDKVKPTHIDFLSHHKKGQLFVISEIKKASPSKGIIREDFDPVEIAKIYESSGASAISVLTDEKYFKGKLSYLQRVSQEVILPLLRKDFIIDTYQILEAYYCGASAILLIVSALTSSQIKKYIGFANRLGLKALIEVHNEEELNTALEANGEIIGINNRDLKTFHTDLKQTEALIPMIPKDKIVISESGIHKPEDIEYLKSLGVDGVLIGEAFMRKPDIASQVRWLLGGANNFSKV